MERERSRQEQTADTDKLYPQIAEALNISISQLEQYPSDMKQILCQAYINNCELGKDDVAEALNGIVNLDIDEVGIKEIEKQQDNTAVDNELRQTEVTERSAIVYDGYTSVSAVIKGMGYVGSTANRSQNAVNAVKYIFDDNNLAVRHRLFYMCTKDYYDSTPGNFHSTQSFILQYENVLFFDRWQKK